MCPIKIFSRKKQNNTMAASAVPCLLSFLEKTQHVHEILMLFTYVTTFPYDLNQLTNLHKTEAHGYHPNPATPKVQHTLKQEHTTNVVIEQKSRRLLMMDVLMSKTR